ncbi:hypothetical protein CASFOL_034400 [Castilleja foliolosa]|uniref:Chromo domain-containing protein n=1 Tax=Castilleja foliolosa TaxID=1961234 RepID=A0ABD3BW49_9LAMI
MRGGKRGSTITGRVGGCWRLGLCDNSRFGKSYWVWVVRVMATAGGKTVKTSVEAEIKGIWNLKRSLSKTMNRTILFLDISDIEAAIILKSAEKRDFRHQLTEMRADAQMDGHENVFSLCNKSGDLKIVGVRQRQYLVKYHGLAHIHNHWVPEKQLLLENSCLVSNFIEKEQGTGRYGVEEGVFGAAAPLKAPKWYKRKVVSFGFGGKLVSFNSAESPAGSSEVYVHNLVTEHGLISRSSEFEAAIQNGDRSALKILCERKSQESESEEERETWGFMKVMFNEDGTARSKLLSHLGFSLPAEESGTSKDDVSEQVNALGLDESSAVKGVSESKESALLAFDNGEDFFSNLPSPKTDTPRSISKDEFVVGDSVKESEPEIDGPEESSDPSFDDAVQRALVVGDYKGAVAQCLSSNRLADALVIAHVGGGSLWNNTRDQYLKTSSSPYLKVVSAMVNNDLMSIANTRPLKSWKETLALFCTRAVQKVKVDPSSR